VAMLVSKWYKSPIRIDHATGEPMKIALCHLSDLHIKTPSDPILTRAKAILSAVRPRLSKDVAPLLVCSGDIAYSGGKAQYDLAHSFIAEMQTALNEMGDRNLLGTIVVPGNHDCDFSAAGDARPHLISGIGSAIDEADLRGESMQDLLKVHNNFFDFAQKLANPPPLKHDRIGWTVSYQHDGGTILVRCLNTALLSRKEEVPAQLRFPLKAIPDRSGDSDFALTLFHHPYAWLAPENRRELQRRVESISDLVLTGHEHDGASYVRETPDGETDYVEGAALQADGPTGFNLILVDTAASTNQIFRFGWDGEIYKPLQDCPSAKVFTRKRSLIESRFELKPEFLRTLQDSGTGFSHPTGGELNLESIFVYPELKVARLSSSSRSTIQSGDLVSYIATRDQVQISGPPLSGKSTLVRALYLDLRRLANAVPILLNGAEIRASSKEQFHRLIEHALCQQYQISSPERFRQLARNRKMLLIDDWHRCRLLAKLKATILDNARESFGRLVLFSDDVSVYRLLIEGPTDPSGAEAEICEIQQFGYRLRTALIRKWHSFGASHIYSDKQPTRLKDDIEFINNLRSRSPDVFLTGTNVDQNRDEHRTQMDVAEAAAPDQEDAMVPRTEYTDTVAESLKVDFAFKSLQVMGQVLKNFPLDLKADLKLSLTKRSYELTLRTLRRFLELVELNVGPMILAFERSVKMLQPFTKKTDEGIRDDSKMFLVTLSEL